MRYFLLIVLTFLVSSLNAQYVFTENNCLMFATEGSDIRETFEVDRLRYFDRYNQTYLFDDKSVLSVKDADILNYDRDSLKAQIDIWMDTCQVNGTPSPPVTPSLFVNHKSLDFDGINQNFSIADKPELSFVNDSINLSAWIRMGDATNFPIFSKTNEYLLWVNASDKIEARFIDASTGGYIGRTYNTAITTSENEWHHVSASFDGTTVKIFLNGIQRDDTDANSGSFTSMENTASNLFMGYHGGAYGTGEVDQAFVASAPIGLADVKSVMAVRDLSYLTVNGVGWWEFDDSDVTGSVVSDRIGSNNGTMINSPDRTLCVEYPYSYQLYNVASLDSLTPMQDTVGDAFGGFEFNTDAGVEYVDFGNVADWDFGNGTTDQPFSFSIFTRVTGGASELLSKSVTSSAREFVYRLSGSNEVQLFLYDLNSSNYIGRKTGVIGQVGQNVHLVATYDGAGVIKLYINSIQSDNADLTAGSYTAMHNTSSSLQLGRWQTGYTQTSAPQLAIFNRVLTQDEVDSLYNNHAPVNILETGMGTDLLGYYEGFSSATASNGIVDLSGNGNHGNPFNLDLNDIQYSYPRAFFEADSSGSFSFDGSTERIDISDDPSLSFTDDSVYLSAFINMDDATSFPIFSKAHEYLFWVNASDKLEARFIDSSSAGYIGRTYNTAITGNQNEWIFVEATFDGTNVDIRIDGVTVDDTDANSGSFTSMENTSNDLYIAYDGSNYADGSFHLVSIGGTTTDLCEGQEAFNGGSPVDPRLTTFNSIMVSSWRLNQGDNPAGTVTDIVGSNNGTSVNSPTLSTTSYPTN